MAWYVYKCNSRALDYQSSWGDWQDFFQEGRVGEWGSTEHIPQLAEARRGDRIIAYQTNRNEIVGLASVVRWAKKGSHRHLILKPIREIHEKVRPLKLANPRIAAIDAFKPGPIRTLYRISQRDVRLLLRAAEADSSEGWQQDEDKAIAAHRGAGFGTPANNRKVEKAAVAEVTRWYRKRKWRVKSIEKDNLGYDLECRRSGASEHVEVKGVSGKACSFLITARERRTWAKDKHFVLAVVTSATSQKPLSRFYRKPESIDRFEFKPVSYVARLRASPTE